MIEIRQVAGDEFEVTVRDAQSTSRHHVMLSAGTCVRLGKGARTAEQVLDASFRFLLDREPKESILSRFDIGVIARYFPEFERELPAYF